MIATLRRVGTISFAFFAGTSFVVCLYFVKWNDAKAAVIALALTFILLIYAYVCSRG